MKPSRYVIAACIAHGCLVFAGAATDVPSLDNAVWHFRLGDHPEWAGSGHDDSQWERVGLPHGFDAGRPPHRGWYRVRFTVPGAGVPSAARPGDSRFPPALGIYFGRIITANEVYLNGRRIGGDGRVDRDFVDAPHVERVYALPDALLLPGTNTLAIRVQSSVARGGLVGGQPRLGPYADLAVDVHRRAQKRKVIEGFVAGMLAMVMLIWVLLHKREERAVDDLALGGLLVLLATLFVLESQLFYDTGFVTPLMQRLIVVLFLALPAPAVLLPLQFVDSPGPRRVHVALAVLSALLAVVYAVIGGLVLCMWMARIWYAIVIVGISLLGWQAWRLRNRADGTITRSFVVGFAWFILCGGADYVVSERAGLPTYYGVLFHVGFLGFVAAMACALAFRFRRLNAQAKQLSRQLVTTEERERRRLAGVLHGDIAPTLATVKLDLQLLLRDTNRQAAGRGIVNRLAHAIDATRTVSHELRPAGIGQIGLPATLRGLATRFAARTGWRLDLDLPDDGDGIPAGITQETMVSLYRMAQEALHNIDKHAEAGSVRISLRVSNGGVLMVIADDGRGYDPAEASKGGGLGWLLLRERSEALGGHCIILGRTHKGVEVRVWLPQK